MPQPAAFTWMTDDLVAATFCEYIVIFISAPTLRWPCATAHQMLHNARVSAAEQGADRWTRVAAIWIRCFCCASNFDRVWDDALRLYLLFSPTHHTDCCHAGASCSSRPTVHDPASNDATHRRVLDSVRCSAPYGRSNELFASTTRVPSWRGNGRRTLHDSAWKTPTGASMDHAGGHSVGKTMRGTGQLIS